jgi:hypothetical protein
VSRILVLALVAALLGGCGGDGVDPDLARERVEAAAGVALTEQEPPVPEVERAFMAAAEGQYVQLFLLADAADAARLHDLVPGASRRGRVRTAVNRNVYLVYSAAQEAESRGDAVVAAVAGL